MQQPLKSLPRSRYRTPCAQKNDGLGWKDGLAVRWSGLTIGIRCNHSEILPILCETLPTDATPCQEIDCDLLMSVIRGGEVGRGRKNFHIVYNGWTRIARTHDWDEAMSIFQRSLGGYMALLASEHSLWDCYETTLGGQRTMICPDPSDRQHIRNTFPTAQEWVNIQQPQDCPAVVLVTDSQTDSCRPRTSPSEIAFELLRFSGLTRSQPEKILALVTQLGQLVTMSKVPANSTFEQFEQIVREHPQHARKAP